MYNQELFNQLLSNYEKCFTSRWPNENFKLKAVKHFQNKWDINAKDFSTMLEDALSETSILLMSAKRYPKKMIVAYAKRFPSEIKELFINLFDESKNLVNRINDFIDKVEKVNEKYCEGKKTLRSYQDYLAVSIYLWLMYPEKYYIFKFSEYKAFCKKIGNDFVPKQGHREENIVNGYKLLDEISKKLSQDTNFINLFDGKMSEDLYEDINYKTRTFDIVRFAYTMENDNSILSKAEIKFEKSYGKKDFLKEVYIDASEYDELKEILIHKKNIILKGAPGVGKTFMAKRLAFSMMGEKDESRIKLVQFHQNYSYEDFIMGYKPTNEGFELKKGVFYEFCTEANKNKNKDYFFIIDEINRGNLSKIFGELLMLIEKDKRGTDYVNLAYNNELFTVPENIYIIGTMNTADRSLALIDYALRRRFSFYAMVPAFENQVFKEYQKRINNDTLNLLIEKIKNLNETISTDPSLGEGFEIGHSYFCELEGKCNEDILSSIIDYEIIPMIEEYWFDDKSKVEEVKKDLTEVF